MVIYVEASGCTNTCRHCAAGGHPPHGSLFSLAELRALREEWGGICPLYEPSAHPDFPEILDAAGMVGQGNILASNGYGLARREDYRDVFARLLDMGYNMVAFTLHGMERHHDWFVRRAGAFQDIVTATRRASECGLWVHWNAFLDTRNLEELPAMADLARSEFAGRPWSEVANHRVSRRLWRYEALRPSLRDIQDRLPHDLWLEKWQNGNLEAFTEAAWLNLWRRNPEAEEVCLPFDPGSWRMRPPFKNAKLYITRQHQVYFDPYCGDRILLGPLSDGRAALLKRLEEVSSPCLGRLRPEDISLPPGDAGLLHATVCSVRFKAISRALYAHAG